MLCRRGKSSCADTSQQASSVSSRERKRAWLLAPGFLGLRVAEQLGERKNSVWLRGVSACVAWLVSRTFSQAVGVCCLQFALDSLWIKALCCPLELLLTPPKPWHPPERWFEGSTQPHLLPFPVTHLHATHTHLPVSVMLCHAPSPLQVFINTTSRWEGLFLSPPPGKPWLILSLTSSPELIASLLCAYRIS